VSQATRVNRQRLSRPALRITRQADHDGASSFVFEVWSPFVGQYQPVESIDIALRRIDELTRLICQMWLQRHPKQDTLVDVPDPAPTEGVEWAEFRINATTFRSYDTRGYDRLGWTRAAGLTQATRATCGKVGYALPASAAA
jgi:hypothetical protein